MSPPCSACSGTCSTATTRSAPQRDAHRNPEEKEKAEAAGATFDRVLGIDDLVRSDDVFFAATGVTDGEMLQGVKYHMNWAETESLVTRSRSGTLRRIYARHHWGYKQREWLGQPEEG